MKGLGFQAICNTTYDLNLRNSILINPKFECRNPTLINPKFESRNPKNSNKIWNIIYDLNLRISMFELSSQNYIGSCNVSKEHCTFCIFVHFLHFCTLSAFLYTFCIVVHFLHFLHLLPPHWYLFASSIPPQCLLGFRGESRRIRGGNEEAMRRIWDERANSCDGSRKNL
jgi:hypothetical protein